MTDATDPATWTLLAAAAAIRARTISAVELTEAMLTRIDAWQPVVNAFIALDADGALAQAEAADAKLARGETVGPFHGVPFAHKDMLDRPGRITGCGSKVRGDHVASTTATVLERLDAAGALDLGRLNMSEFALGPTGINAHHGRARNPWDPARITGGSSSGSGAGVAAGLFYGAIGSDTGGSIRLPAAMCGIAGLKPTLGRVSRYGAMPLSFSQDCLGPMAPTVADVAAFFSVIAGPDGRDPTVVDRRLGAVTAPSSLAGVTIGVCESWLDDLDPPTAAAHQDMIRLFRDLGAAIVPVDLPDPLELGELSNIIAMTEAASIHADWLRTRPQDYGPQVRARLRQGMAIPGALYLRAVAMRSELLERFVAAFGQADVLALPALPFLPPENAPLEASAGTGGTTGASGIPALLASIARYSRPISYVGLPALAQPIALSDTHPPVAMQLVGRPFAEAQILSIGMCFERAAGFDRRRLPTLPASVQTA